jgi:histidine triad (HIT) family protein
VNPLKRLANSAAGAALIGWIFSQMSSVIPAKRLRESETLLAFFHPRPAYPFHVILTPKKDIRTFADLSPTDPFLAEMVSTAQGLVTEFHLASWRLIVNGGENQKFPHLHFHLISEELPQAEESTQPKGK